MFVESNSSFFYTISIICYRVIGDEELWVYFNRIIDSCCHHRCVSSNCGPEFLERADSGESFTGGIRYENARYFV